MRAERRRSALEFGARELRELRNSKHAKRDTWLNLLLGEVERLPQFYARISDDRTATDRPPRIQPPRDVGLDVHRVQPRFLDNKATGEVIRPLRGEAIWYVDAESIRELAALIMIVYEKVR